MAAFTKFADNEMNYYQFKAKQILLQKKEEKEWQDFCKQVAPDCAVCLPEKAEVNESKDRGIQTIPKKPISRTDKIAIQPKYRNKDLPETLIDMNTKLEKIGLVLSKLFVENEKVSQKQVLSETKPAVQERIYKTIPPVFPTQQPVKSLEEQRKLQIQNAFKRSLQNSSIAINKKPLAIKPKNSSFFLPHNLEVKRAAARKAYLASLQTVPKVSFLNKRQSSNEKAKTSQSKKNVSTRKKILPKKENPKSKENKEETLLEANNTKDENIEGVVDAMFDDLFEEVVLDLNRIRQKKREKCYHTQYVIEDRVKRPSVLGNPSTSSFCDDSKFVANNSSIMILKSFIESSEVIQEGNNLRKKQIELADKSTDTLKIEDSRAVHHEYANVASSSKELEVPKTIPKFECSVKHIIKIDPKKAEDIISKRNRFWKYLENSSQTAKENFNPWILNEMLAESIVDDCIKDVEEELYDLPSSIIQDLYNQEFMQHVEI